MVNENSLSPEKQLLNLIENPKAKDSLKTATIKYQSLGLFSLGAFKGRWAFFKNKGREFFFTGKFFDLKFVNQVLRIFVFILGFYFLLNLGFGLINLRKELAFQIKEEKVSGSSSLPVSSFLKGLTSYLEKARERDIFKMGLRVSPQDLGVRLPSERIVEVTKNLKLVGIAWSEDPDVMIEDTQHQRTYFLKKGQVMDNGVKLKAVFKDKVILSWSGEEIELR